MESYLERSYKPRKSHSSRTIEETLELLQKIKLLHHFFYNDEPLKTIIRSQVNLKKYVLLVKNNLKLLKATNIY